MAETYPLALQTAYRDLLDRQLRRPRPDYPGSILKIQNKGSAYWVARQRVGDAVTERRIGPDNEATRNRLDAIRAGAEAAAAWDRDMAALVAQLRAARMPVPTPGTGKLLNALARAGFFASGGVLAGTHAYGLYGLELGQRLDTSLALTEDVDIAATRAVRIIADRETSLASSLEGIGLVPVAGPGEAHPVRWQTSDNVTLDLLTPLRRGGRPVVRHEGLGVWAQALPFLDFSLKDPIDAVALYREGILVRIPSPERYAVHKLIVASARTGTHRAKVEKDLAQAAALIGALAEARPYELMQALGEAKGSGPKWKAAIDASLTRKPDIARAIDSLA